MHIFNYCIALTIPLPALASFALGSSYDGADHGISRRTSSCSVKINQSTKAQLLNYHNSARELTDADPLSWSDDLYCSAQQWADRCVFEHSHTSGLGENIGCGYGNGYTALTAVEDWWNEYSKYKLGDGFSDAAGHYTQVVWKNTTLLGCGVATCTADQLGLSGGGTESSIFVVCQYKAPGNVQGYFTKYVSLPSSSQQPTADGSSSSTSNQNNDQTGSSSSDSTSSKKSTSTTSSTSSAKTTKHKTHKSHHKAKTHRHRHGTSHGSTATPLVTIKQVQKSDGQNDCEEGTESGKTSDGGDWSYSWKSWSSSTSSKRSPTIDDIDKSEAAPLARDEQIVDGLDKRTAQAVALSQERLGKKRIASASR